MTGSACARAVAEAIQPATVRTVTPLQAAIREAGSKVHTSATA